MATAFESTNGDTQVFNADAKEDIDEQVTTLNDQNLDDGTAGTLSKPDGGWSGWGAVLGAWLVQFSMLGAVTSFGVYQTFYTDHYLPSSSTSEISWIGTLQLFMEFFLGIFVGKLLDAGYFRGTVMTGSALFVFTMFMLSLAKKGQYYQIFLAQGVGMGAGLGISYLPTSGLVSQYFTKRRSLALGIATTGTSLGGFAFSLLFNFMLNGNIGFAWGTRIGAFMCLGCLLVANIVVPRPISPERKEQSKGPKRSPATIASLLRNPAYVFTIASGFVVSLGLYFPMFTVQLFAINNGLSERSSFFTLSIINISSIFGRLIPNHLADRYGVFEIYVPCTALAGVLVFSLAACKSIGALVAFCVLYGFFSGSIASLYFPTVVSLDPDVGTTGLRLGLACTPVGLGFLIGTPISTAIMGGDSKWWKGTVFSGTCEITSATLLLTAYMFERRKKARASSCERSE